MSIFQQTNPNRRRYGLAVFIGIIAGIISVIAVVLTALLLPETNKHMGEVKKGNLFDFTQCSPLSMSVL